MPGRHWNTRDDDEELVAELRRILVEIEPVADPLRTAAREALDPTPGADVAALVHDSVGDDECRTLRFACSQLEIEVDAEPQASERTLRISGRLMPPQTAQIRIAAGGAIVLTRADEHGRFAAVGIAPGLLRLRCWLDGAPDGGRLVETTWLHV